MGRVITAAAAALLLLVCFPHALRARGGEAIPLPEPAFRNGGTFFETLRARRSDRDFRVDPLPRQILADLLWSAVGVNRPESGKRTSPTAMDRREIDVYASLAEGLFLYDPEAHALIPILEEDIRDLTGRQPFTGDAPLNLIFVADDEKMGGMGEEDRIFYAAADAGFASQNVYLACADLGLVTVVRAWIDREALAERMGLPPHRRIVLAQTVGYPAEPDPPEAETGEEE
ncbi:MAG: SagB/ThcOx family dehydrogenase [Candidatus Eisenbacteria bacterium]|nr:SagB/ThcOx family dehydrogenase [Candidatus Eisenbacteria bacterium]